MDERIREAVSLFEEVLIYGTERVIRSVDDPIWKEYSPEQIQVLKLIYKEGRNYIWSTRHFARRS